MKEKTCDTTMHSVAELGHTHLCQRPEGHTSDPRDRDHYCRGCNRFFYPKR